VRRLTTCKSLSSIGFRCVREVRVIKLDIVNAIVQKTNITRTKAEQAVETVFEAMKNALGRGDRIELRRFGVFNVKPRKTGIGRNPRTGQQVSIPPGKAVRFKPGKELQALPPSPAPKS
jgi:DNA-binding protein HU-beta